jgi:hypothetical protein
MSFWASYIAEVDYGSRRFDGPTPAGPERRLVAMF